MKRKWGKIISGSVLKRSAVFKIMQETERKKRERLKYYQGEGECSKRWRGKEGIKRRKVFSVKRRIEKRRGGAKKREKAGSLGGETTREWGSNQGIEHAAHNVRMIKRGRGETSIKYLDQMKERVKNLDSRLSIQFNQKERKSLSEKRGGG